MAGADNEAEQLVLEFIQKNGSITRKEAEAAVDEIDVNGEPPAELRYFYDLHSEILDNPDLEWVGDMEP